MKTRTPEEAIPGYTDGKPIGKPCGLCRHYSPLHHGELPASSCLKYRCWVCHICGTCPDWANQL